MPGFAVAQADQGLFPGAGQPLAFDPPPESFGGQVAAAFHSSWDIDRLGARDEAYRTTLWARHAQVQQATGVSLKPSFAMGEMNAADPREPTGALGTGSLADDQYEAQLDKLRVQQPQAMAGVETARQIHDRLAAGWNAEAARAGRAGLVPRLLGGLGASAVDPLNLALGVASGGAADAPIAMRLLGQAGVWGAAAAVQAPFRADEAARQGGPAYGAGDAASDILTSAAGGALFEGLHIAGHAAFRVALNKLRPDLDAAGPAARGALNQLDQADLLTRALGPLDGPTHEEGLDSLVNLKPLPEQEPAKDLPDLFGDPVPRTGLPADATPGVTGATEYYGRPIYQGTFDPAGLGTDPARFQYKADADAAGVTARLKGIAAWDPTASGKVIVYRDLDGRELIADGHQRLALANRLDAKGFEPRLDGYLFDAKDGWTATQVRTVAALKNIREGSGSILDAAKVFRDAPEHLNDRSLPVTGDFITQARGLARLDPEAFGAVVNKVIPERYGAELGAMAAERPDLHMGLVKLLKAGDPANLDDARSLISEGLLDDWLKGEGEQGGLFGEHDFAESATIARAKVKSAVLQALRKDARIFGQLVRHADAIEAGGNALLRDANETNAAVSRTAVEVLQRLSLRAGDVGEAVAAAAREVHAGAKASEAAKGVLAMVRSRLAAGEDLDGLRLATLDPQAPGPHALELAQKLDDVHSAEAQALVKEAPEDAEAVKAADGLFDDLAELGPEERAHARLKACAPGE